MKLKGLVLIVLAAFMAGALVYYLGFWSAEPTQIDFDRTGPRLVALSALALVLGASLIFSRPRLRDVAGAVILWGGLAVVLIAGYSMRYQLEDIARNTLGALIPGLAVQQTDGTVALARDRSGHYVLDARVDGAPVRFLVDTGASMVTLTAEDAASAGIDVAGLNFGAVVSTANGRAQVAAVRLARVEIAGATLTGLRAFVARPGALETSLFGMNALERFTSWTVEGGRMILRP